MAFKDVKMGPGNDSEIGNRSEDWIKTPENIASEMAIHDQLEKEYRAKVEKKKRAARKAAKARKDRLDGTT